MAADETSDSPYLRLQDVVVQQDTYMDDFRTHLLPAIRPSWKDLTLDSKVFDSGITNALVAIFDKEKGLDKSRENVILVRINGIGSEIIIDRVDELVCLVELNKVGLFPPVYAEFSNGLCYGYYPGRQVGVAEVREEGICRKIAGVLARLHCVEIPRHFQGRGPVMWGKVGVAYPRKGRCMVWLFAVIRFIVAQSPQWHASSFVMYTKASGSNWLN